MQNNWQEAITAYIRHLRAAGRPATTIRLRRNQLNQLAASLRTGPWTTTPDQLVAHLARPEWANETRRSVRSGLRIFYAWALDAGHVAASPAAKLPTIKETPPCPRPASDETMRHVSTSAKPWVRLAIRLASEMGLRRGEVARIHSGDILDGIGGTVLIVHGKGARERVIPMPDALARDLVDACQLGGGWAFPDQIDGHVSPDWVGVNVARALPGRATMHQLRHRFATRAYAATGDLLAVQQLMGHASPKATMRYVGIDDACLRAVLLSAA